MPDDVHVQVDGLSGSICELSLHPLTTVLELKRRIQQEADVPVKRQRLVLKERILQDGWHDEDALFMFCDFGGAKRELQFTMTKRTDDQVETLLAMSACQDVCEFLQSFGASRMHLLDDEDVIKVAVQHSPNAMEYASERLKCDRRFLLSMLDVRDFGGQYCLEHASAELRSDRAFALEALGKRADVLKNLSEALKSDRDVATQAVLGNPRMLEHAGDAFRKDDAIVRLAVERDGLALAFASDACKANKDTVLSAVKDDGLALKFASRGLRADKEVVLAAVQSTGLAMRYADEELKQNEEISRHVDAEMQAWLQEHLDPLDYGLPPRRAPKTPEMTTLSGAPRATNA